MESSYLCFGGSWRPLNCLAKASHSFLWIFQCSFWHWRSQYWTALQLEHLLSTFSWPQVKQQFSSANPRCPLILDVNILSAVAHSELCFVLDRLTRSWRNTVVSLNRNVRIDSLTKLSKNSKNPSVARPFRNNLIELLINSVLDLSAFAFCCPINQTTKKSR